MNLLTKRTLLTFAFGLTLIWSAAFASGNETTTTISKSDAVTTVSQTPVTQLKQLSIQLMNTVKDNETDKIEGLAQRAVVSATDLRNQAALAKNTNLAASAGELMEIATALEKIGRDGTIAENGMLLEKFHQQVITLPANGEIEIKDLGNTKCPVSGAPVGSMQKGSHIVYKGMRIGLCCDSCKNAFLADPETAIEKARKSVP